MGTFLFFAALAAIVLMCVSERARKIGLAILVVIGAITVAVFATGAAVTVLAIIVAFAVIFGLLKLVGLIGKVLDRVGNGLGDGFFKLGRKVALATLDAVFPKNRRNREAA